MRGVRWGRSRRRMRVKGRGRLMGRSMGLRMVRSRLMVCRVEG